MMRIVLFATVALVVLTGLSAARLTPAARCAKLKRKAAGAKVADKLACNAAAVGRPGGTPDPVCLAKAEQRFQGAFARAERKGGCSTVGDTAAIEARVDACVADLVEQLPASGTTTTTLPPPPGLGTQLDRAGRPGVNILLGHGFDGDANATGAFRDAYNQASDRSAWASDFVAPLRTSLAYWDGIDGVCGNQLFAGSIADATRYATLAQLLVDDRLLLNATSGACDSYLAVEFDAAGLPSSDCGGRRPGLDTADITYSELIGGDTSGAGDGINANGTAISRSTFPFLAAPH